jgi:hypothetical protein
MAWPSSAQAGILPNPRLPYRHHERATAGRSPSTPRRNEGAGALPTLSQVLVEGVGLTTLNAGLRVVCVPSSVYILAQTLFVDPQEGPHILFDVGWVSRHGD